MALSDAEKATFADMCSGSHAAALGLEEADLDGKRCAVIVGVTGRNEDEEGERITMVPLAVLVDQDLFTRLEPHDATVHGAESAGTETASGYVSDELENKSDEAEEAA